LIALNYVGNGSPNIQLAANSIRKHKSHNDLGSKVVLPAFSRDLARVGQGSPPIHLFRAIQQNSFAIFHMMMRMKYFGTLLAL
jgi:hypothetical protein